MKIPETNDGSWKLGHLYYNPENPALFVRKRSGLGVTLNWAKPGSWLLSAAVVGLVVKLVRR